MKIIQRICPKFQRASIDEAYMDVTETVNERIKQCRENGIEKDVIAWEGTQVIGNAQDVQGESTDGNMYADHKGSLTRRQLYFASQICSQVRQAIRQELGYTCSAGIAHNKTLAKLVSAKHKPDRQSVLLDSEVLNFMKELPFTKIKGLGGVTDFDLSLLIIGKLGDEVESKLQVEHAGDIWEYSLPALQSKFGQGSGTWLYNICRGICYDEGIFMDCIVFIT